MLELKYRRETQEMDEMNYHLHHLDDEMCKASFKWRMWWPSRGRRRMAREMNQLKHHLHHMDNEMDNALFKWRISCTTRGRRRMARQLDEMSRHLHYMDHGMCGALFKSRICKPAATGGAWPERWMRCISICIIKIINMHFLYSNECSPGPPPGGNACSQR